MKIYLIIIAFISVIFHSKSDVVWERIVPPNCNDIYDIEIDSVGRIFVGSNGYNCLFFSDVNGSSWKIIDNNLFGNVAVSQLSINDSNLFVGTFGQGVFRRNIKNNDAPWVPVNNDFIIDSTIRSIWSMEVKGTNIYLGTPGSGIIISRNLGESWEFKNNGLPIVDIIEGICILDTTVFIGVCESFKSYGIYKSSNYGEIWESTNSGLPDVSNTFIEELLVNEKTLFAGTNKGVFVSSDGGENWFEKNNGITDFKILSLALNDKYLFAGTFNGKIFMSKNNGESWIRIDDDVTQSRIQTLAIGNGYVFAGTSYGKPKGIFRAKLSDIETSVTETPEIKSQLVYPNPNNGILNIKSPKLTEGILTINVYDINGVKVHSTIKKALNKEINIQMPSNVTNGAYFLKLINSENQVIFSKQFYIIN